MPLLSKQGVLLITADTNDILSSHPVLRAAGPGRYRITALAAAAPDATITVNDGQSDVVSGEPIAVKAASVTFPAFDRSADVSYVVDSKRSDRLLVNVTDGTNGELAILIEKIG